MMAAPEGNQFWKLRSKHGRDKLFSTPELLWEASCEYFEYTDNRKWIKKDWVGKDTIEVERESETPYTISGLCLYLGASRSWWKEFRANASEDFLSIISRIEDIMFTQKFEGAAVGAFNGNIIARDLGLADKTESEVKQDIRVKTDLSKLNLDELKALRDINNKLKGE